MIFALRLMDSSFKDEQGGVRYYRHCDQLQYGCRGKAIITIYANAEKVWKLTKSHSGHAECLMDREAIKLRSEIKDQGRFAPEKSSRDIYEEVMSSKLS